MNSNNVFSFFCVSFVFLLCFLCVFWRWPDMRMAPLSFGTRLRVSRNHRWLPLAALAKTQTDRRSINSETLLLLLLLLLLLYYYCLLRSSNDISLSALGEVMLQVLYKLKTAKVFERARGKEDKPSAELAEEDPFAIQTLTWCPESRVLCVAGVLRPRHRLQVQQAGSHHWRSAGDQSRCSHLYLWESCVWEINVIILYILYLAVIILYILYLAVII